MTDDHPALAELSRKAQESAEAYLAGDLGAYAEILPHADDFTLMAPFGGPTRHGFVLDDETREATRSMFRGGEVHVDIDASYVTDDLAVLAWVMKTWGGELAAFRTWRDAQDRETREAIAKLPVAERVS